MSMPRPNLVTTLKTMNEWELMELFHDLGDKEVANLYCTLCKYLGARIKDLVRVADSELIKEVLTSDEYKEANDAQTDRINDEVKRLRK